jgi:hypothetical protein
MPESLIDARPHMLDAWEVADLLRCDRQTVLRKRRAGMFPDGVMLAHKWLWREDKILALLDGDAA